MSKGSGNRVKDFDKYRSNWDDIFGEDKNLALADKQNVRKCRTCGTALAETDANFCEECLNV